MYKFVQNIWYDMNRHWDRVDNHLGHLYVQHWNSGQSRNQNLYSLIINVR